MRLGPFFRTCSASVSAGHKSDGFHFPVVGIPVKKCWRYSNDTTLGHFALYHLIWGQCAFAGCRLPCTGCEIGFCIMLSILKLKTSIDCKRMRVWSKSCGKCMVLDHYDMYFVHYLVFCGFGCDASCFVLMFSELPVAPLATNVQLLAHICGVPDQDFWARLHGLHL